MITRAHVLQVALAITAGFVTAQQQQPQVLTTSGFSAKQVLNNSDITDATYNLYVWQVLGFRYKEEESPVWRKGEDEGTAVGGTMMRKEGTKKVRAVCLGVENGYAVLMTLRSFVDPTFPNPFIQGVRSQPKDKDGKPVWEKDGNANGIVRYGRITIASYQDLGGGELRVVSSASGVTHADTDTPRTYGGWVTVSNPKTKEPIDGVTYQVPHQQVTAKEHNRLKDEYNKNPVSIKGFKDHDIVFLYVPVALFNDKKPRSLEIKNPTAAGMLMFDHNQELFGFKFSLMGEETLTLIRGYEPPSAKQGEWVGIPKVINIVGLALSPETLRVLKCIDGALDAYVPDELAKCRSRIELGAVLWDSGKALAIQLATDDEVLSKVRASMWPALKEIWRGASAPAASK